MVLPRIRQLALTLCVYERKRSVRVERSVGDMVVQTKKEPRLLEWGPKYLSSLLGELEERTPHATAWKERGR